MPGMARSSPGQPKPAPSAVQDTPNDESRMPMVSFSVFLGIRASGR